MKRLALCALFTLSAATLHGCAFLATWSGTNSPRSHTIVVTNASDYDLEFVGPDGVLEFSLQGGEKTRILHPGNTMRISVVRAYRYYYYDYYDASVDIMVNARYPDGKLADAAAFRISSEWYGHRTTARVIRNEHFFSR